MIDERPRRWTAEEVQVLADAALGVQRELDLRVTIRDLNEARRERDNLVQALAHDLRSPLTTVMAGVEMLGRDDLASEHRESVSAAVTRQSQRLAAMAHRLLGQDGDGGSFAAHQPVDEVVNTIVLARSIAGHASRLSVDIGPGTDVVLPAEPVASIVTNLVDNALSHTRGQVRVTAGRRGGELVLTVADDGPGYDVEAVDAGRQAARGFGLGRAIVAHHVAGLGGTREIRSDLERGTTVSVTLPVAG